MASSTGGVPAHNVFTFGSITFSANFDNGNLARVEQVPNKSYDFRIWTAPDNMSSSYQSKHCAWYYFMVTGLPQGCVLRIQIVNTSNHSGLYKYDMRPVYRSNSTNQKWVRIKSSVRFSKDSSTPNLFFEHGVEVADDKLYFAFTYPYTYTMVQNELEDLDTNHSNRFEDKNSIYYRRELLTRSLDGRRVDLITVTSVDGASPSEREPLLSGLFPDTKHEHDRPPVFPEKEVVFVSARVHPGEVPAQHTFKGIFNLLMDPNDLRAKELRARYVFKLIPMLNPDGVYRGHFRMDQLGQNLNRYYTNSDPMLQPSIFAAKSLTEHYATQGKLSVYLDFHAHASKRGCFIYGNVLDSAEDQIQNQLYCKLIALNSAHFDYEGCLFSRDHMTRIDPGDQAKGLTAEGSGRVSMYLAHGIIHSYTIECNYNTSRVGNEIAPTDSDPGGAAVNPPSPFTTNPEKYTPATFAGVGRACVIALLDIRGHNPCSRLSKSKFKTLDRVRNSVMMEVRSRKEYIGKAINRERRRSMVALERRSGDLAVSMDDICWRRTVESTEPQTQPAISGPSPPPGAILLQSASAKEPTVGKPSDVFFVSMKEPRRRQRSASAVQVPVAQVQIGVEGPSGRSGGTGNGTGNSSRSDTPLREIFTALPPRSAAAALAVAPAVARASVRTDANSNYVPNNGLTPHLSRKSAQDPVRPVDLVRDAASSKAAISATSADSTQPDSRSSTPSMPGGAVLPRGGSAATLAPQDLGLRNTPLLGLSVKRASTPGSECSVPTPSVLGSATAIATSKSGRNILGKKLHAAGVALVMGNNSLSFNSLEGALNDVAGTETNELDGVGRDALDMLTRSRHPPRDPQGGGGGSMQRPASAGPSRVAGASHSAPRMGIAVEEDFDYHLSAEPRLSPAHRDPYATSPVKSIRSPQAHDLS